MSSFACCSELENYLTIFKLKYAKTKTNAANINESSCQNVGTFPITHASMNW